MINHSNTIYYIHFYNEAVLPIISNELALHTLMQANVLWILQIRGITMQTCFQMITFYALNLTVVPV